MALEGWYYLHTNGALLYKRELGDTAANIRESDFARAMWPFDPQNREGAWNICVEALALGADAARVTDLAKLWQCDDTDADLYADHTGVTLSLDGDQWCAACPGFVNPQESPAGFGGSKLEAMADLCRELGYKGGKLGWHASFKQLVAGIHP